MFTITDDPQVTWPVTVQWPADGGTFEPQVFKARFRILGDDERKRLSDGGDIAAVLRAAVVGWTDIVGPDTFPVDFTGERLERMLVLPPVLAGLTTAYGQILSGKAAEGN